MNNVWPVKLLIRHTKIPICLRLGIVKERGDGCLYAIVAGRVVIGDIAAQQGLGSSRLLQVCERRGE